jgi:MoxR-like ATPase
MDSRVEALIKNISTVIKGKDGEIEFIIAAFLGGGNVLLNDVPGVGKTTLAKAMAKSIGGTFHRIQFTPDLLPADILGGSIYNPREGTFSFRHGPIFANILLADEINRASPRTQSSLLEAMAEEQVTIEGTSYSLQAPFWVIATQNPVEFHGTYPLPEAQLDRFSMQLKMGYPAEDEELDIICTTRTEHPLEKLSSVMSVDDVVELRNNVFKVHVDEDLSRYIIKIITATRHDNRLQLGVSPRGGIALSRMAQAYAFIKGRESVMPDDIKDVAVKTLAHRVMLETKAKYSGITKEHIINEILSDVKVPV